jgi:DNA-directed RNA polymerase specialized sigma24 family protein
MARVVDLHFFAGLSFQSIAQDLGVPQRTLERRWAATRSWLRAEIG